MLCILFDRAQELGLSLHVAHYNHGWRDEDSDADAEFVRSLADAFSLPSTVGKRPSNEAAFTETTARTLRLEFLREVARREQCEVIAFGHQLDDVLETQLQRLARGAGSDGLAAPRPVARFDHHPAHVRPLLHLRAGDIRMSLNASMIPWREDLSNEDLGIARNALRKQIIPDMDESLGREAALGAARSRRLLEEDATALDELARERLPEAYVRAKELSRETLRSAHQALVRRALAAWLSDQGFIGSVSAPAMDLLVETVRSARRKFRMSLGQDFLVVSAESLSVEQGSTGALENELRATSFQTGESVFLSTGALIVSERVELDELTRNRIESGEIDPASEAYLRDSRES
jgi:tRNA(Ile)-lysidine synthase